MMSTHYQYDFVQKHLEILVYLSTMTKRINNSSIGVRNFFILPLIKPLNVANI